MKLLGVHIAMYSSDRYLRMNGMVKNAGAVGRGICAGCWVATTLIKVRYLRPFERTALTIPRVRLRVFVDDLQLGQEDSDADILKHFPKAAAAALTMFKEDRKADVAEDKAALVASNQKLAEKLRAAIGDSTGRPAQVAKNLGIDTSSGRTRRTWARKTTRRPRLGKAAKAALRLKGAETSGTDEDKENDQDQPHAKECLRSAGRRTRQD